MKELISLSEYVLKRSTSEWSSKKRLSAIIGYAEFLNLPIKLGMFVPVHEGFILSKPNYYESFLNNYYLDKPGLIDYESCHRYKKAEDNVLFKSFDVKEDSYWEFGISYKDFWTAFYAWDGKPIGYLLSMFDDIELTESAIKKYNL